MGRGEPCSSSAIHSFCCDFYTFLAQAPTQFTDIWSLIAVINATGTPTYGPAVSNIATIVDSILTGPSGGTVVTQFQKVHLVGLC